MMSTGKPALSAFDQDHHLDYNQYEAKLEIIRKR